MYEVGGENSARAGFKQYGELLVARVVMNRKAFDDMNQRFITNGITPLSEHINMMASVMLILRTANKPQKLEDTPLQSETGQISRFNLENGKKACAVRVTYPKLDEQNFVYSVWLCRPSELK